MTDPLPPPAAPVTSTTPPPAIPSYMPAGTTAHWSESVGWVYESPQAQAINQYNTNQSQQQDAANDFAKQQIAYSQPRNDLAFAHSAEYDRIVGAYNALQQTPESHAAFVQQPGYVGEEGATYTGRAAQYAAGFQPLVASSYPAASPTPYTSTIATPAFQLSPDGAPSVRGYGGSNPYTDMAMASALDRPGYTAPAQLGDRFTQAGALMLTMARGESPTAALGDMLSIQYDNAQKTNGAVGDPLYTQTRDDRYFNKELQKWGENFVETSEAYHYVGADAGKPIPANPFEYQGDLAVEFLKGAPNVNRASEWFSPVSGEMGAQLPGVGVQGAAWNTAITDKPAGVSFDNAVNYLNSAEGKYGPYGKLAGGVDNGYAGQLQYRDLGEIAAGGPAPIVSNEIASQVAPVDYKGAGADFTTTTPLQQQYELSGATPAPSADNGFSWSSWLGNAESIILKAPLVVGASVAAAGALLIPKSAAPIERNTTVVSGGNQTITDLGSWIDTERAGVNPYDSAKVDAFNANVSKYNAMSAENPILTTTTTETTTGGQKMPEFLSFLNNIPFVSDIQKTAQPSQGNTIPGFTSPSAPSGDLFGGVVNAVREKVAWTPLGALLVGTEQEKVAAEQTRQKVSSVTGTVGMVAFPEAGAAETVLGRAAPFALDLPQLIKGTAIAGAVTGGIYAATHYDLSAAVGQKAQELYEGVPRVNLPTVPGFPKINDVIPSQVFNAPGRGIEIVANAPGAGLAILAGLPGAGREALAKTSSAISGGVGGFFPNVIEMPKSEITPYDVIGVPVAIGSSVANNVAERASAVDRAIFDLSSAKDTATSKDTATPKTYADAVAESYNNAGANAYPYANANAGAMGNPYAQSGIFAVTNPAAFVASLLNSKSAVTTQNPSMSSSLVTPAAQSIAITYPKVFVPEKSTTQSTNYDNGTGSRGSPPKNDIDLKNLLPKLPYSNSGGGGSGGAKNQRRSNQTETFYIGPRKVSRPKLVKMPKVKRR